MFSTSQLRFKSDPPETKNCSNATSLIIACWQANIKFEDFSINFTTTQQNSAKLQLESSFTDKIIPYKSINMINWVFIGDEKRRKTFLPPNFAQLTFT